MLKVAEIHALLALAPAGAGYVDAELLRAAELELEHAKARYRDLTAGVDRVHDQLNQYGQDFTGDVNEIAERVGRLMDQTYNSTPDKP